jgi:hypothetical protein
MRCNQLQTIDGCCNPTQCEADAIAVHGESGLGLCATHYGNAEKYCIDGTWSVGTQLLPFPEGWSLLEPSSEGDEASVLAPAEEVRASGLIIEKGTLSPSGLYLE